ncbi:MAG TPA: hypothetical protein VH496_00395 [Mycobacterium sp.]|jgi:hypothetical protein
MAVSWLFVAFIPGLLMLATLGLQRLESRLGSGCVRAVDVAEFLAQARPSEMTTLARDGIGEALDCYQRRRLGLAETPQPVHAGANPQFRQT